MLLKLATYPTENNGWKFFDDVQRLDASYKDISQEQIKKIEDDETGHYDLDCFITGRDKCYCDILFVTVDGMHHRIITGLPAYLCNDSGKTLEVINR